MREFVQFSPSITLGSQKWKGAAPLFNNRADRVIDDKYFVLINSFINSCFIIVMMIENSRIDEANACVRKYFRAASEGIRFLLAVIRGIKASRLISNPIHALNHEFEDTAIRDPLTTIVINIIFDELLNIKKKRTITFINGV